jgi:hypothetical protein
MFDAQILIAPGLGSTVVYSPWMPRQGDNAVFIAEVVEINLATLQVRVFTKAHENAGSGSDADTGTSISISSAGVSSDEWDGLKDLVRFEFTLDNLLNDDQEWVLFRMHEPIWFDSVLVPAAP